MCRRNRLLIALVLVLAASAPGPADIRPDTIAYFSFDGTPGTVFPDSVTDNTATVTFYTDGAPVRYGEPNPVYNSSRTSAHFTARGGLYHNDTGGGDPLDLKLPAYTIEMFLKVDSTAQAVVIRKFWPWHIDLRSDGLHFVHSGADIVGGPISTGRWYHVAAVFDSFDSVEPMKLYLDRAKVAAGGTASINPDSNQDPVGIGELRRSDGSSDQLFAGKIDELRISAAALAPGDFLGAVPTVEFQSDTSAGVEAAGVCGLNVVLTKAQEVPVTVDYALAGGTAADGVDYSLAGSCAYDFDRDGEVSFKDLKTFADNWLSDTLPAGPPAAGDKVGFADFASLALEWLDSCAPGVLLFRPGQTAKTIYIDVADDGRYNEPDETIVLELSNVAGGDAQLGAVNRHTFTIIDTIPEVAFETASSQNMERSSADLVRVNLSHISGEVVTVDYAVIGGTAVGDGVDYMLRDGTLIFNSGETTKLISVRIRNDDEIEDNKTIVLGLSNPTNATLGAVVIHTSTIIDDDAGAWFDGMRWFNAYNRSGIMVDDQGRLEWHPGDGDQMVVNMPAQRFSEVGDVATFSYIWTSDGDHNPNCQCYTDYDPDPDVYDYCTDITCVGGTGDFRMGLFDSNGRGYVTQDRMGENPEIFRGYLGYHFRIFPHVSQDARSRFTEYKTGGGSESHTNTSIWERSNPTQNSALLSNSNSWNRIGSPMEGGFGIPVGGSALMTIRLERTSRDEARISISCNGKTWSKESENDDTIPDKIDVFAIWSNGDNYDYVKFAVP